MASRFAAPVSDSKELKLRSSAIPVKTNACTEWGVKLWADWSRARAKGIIFIVDLSLMMVLASHAMGSSLLEEISCRKSFHKCAKRLG